MVCPVVVTCWSYLRARVDACKRGAMTWPKQQSRRRNRRLDLDLRHWFEASGLLLASAMKTSQIHWYQTCRPYTCWTNHHQKAYRCYSKDKEWSSSWPRWNPSLGLKNICQLRHWTTWHNLSFFNCQRHLFSNLDNRHHYANLKDKWAISKGTNNQAKTGPPKSGQYSNLGEQRV